MTPLRANDSPMSSYSVGPVPAAARDREWVVRIRQGDVAAFEAMYQAYKNELGSYVMSVIGTREAAEEVLQDLFFRLWEQREFWEPAGPVNAYLFRAARNRALNHLRHRQVEKRFRDRTAGELAAKMASAAGAPARAEQALHGQDIEAAINRAVDALPARCREVFRLNRYQRLTYAEVAQVMQISVKTVEMQMGRALASLRRQLADWRE